MAKDAREPEDNTVVVGEYAAHARKAHEEAERRLARGHAPVQEAAAADGPPPMPENWRARCRSTVPLDFSFSEVSTVEDLLTLTPVKREAPPTSSRRPKSGKSGGSAATSKRVPGLRESQYVPTQNFAVPLPLIIQSSQTGTYCAEQVLLRH